MQDGETRRVDMAWSFPNFFWLTKIVLYFHIFIFLVISATFLKGWFDNQAMFIREGSQKRKGEKEIPPLKSITSSAEEYSSRLAISSTGRLTTLLIWARSGSFLNLTLISPSSLPGFWLDPSCMLIMAIVKPSLFDILGEDLIPWSSNAMSVKVFNCIQCLFKESR